MEKLYVLERYPFIFSPLNSFNKALTIAILNSPTTILDLQQIPNSFHSISLNQRNKVLIDLIF